MVAKSASTSQLEYLILASSRWIQVHLGDGDQKRLALNQLKPRVVVFVNLEQDRQSYRGDCSSFIDDW